MGGVEGWNTFSGLLRQLSSLTPPHTHTLPSPNLLLLLLLPLQYRSALCCTRTHTHERTHTDTNKRLLGYQTGRKVPEPRGCKGGGEVVVVLHGLGHCLSGPAVRAQTLVF